jgi:dTDP-4-amino-4,6-dideoxygalactose transaminase
MKKIPLIKPYINQNIKQRVLDVLDSGYLTEGPVTREFEDVFAKYVNAKHAIAVTSCTTGLEMALRAVGIGPGDEVIVPDYTYPATATVVAIVGAHCVIVDVDARNMLIDYNELEKAITPRTKAIIPVSLFGNPLDYNRLEDLKEKHNFFIIEDAACSIGAEYKDQKIGTLADITVFSLHPRKFITTGEGGMITTDNAEWAEWMNSYKHFGMNMSETNREGVQFEITGTNYKLSNLQAAVGLGQMEEIEILLSRRRMLAKRYISFFMDLPGIRLPEITDHGKHSYQSYCIFTPTRDMIMNVLRPKGLEVQIGTYALHLHKAFRDKKYYSIKGKMKGSLTAYEQCLTLPLYHDLTEEDQDYIFESIKSLI